MPEAPVPRYHSFDEVYGYPITLRGINDPTPCDSENMVSITGDPDGFRLWRETRPDAVASMFPCRLLISSPFKTGF